MPASIRNIAVVLMDDLNLLIVRVGFQLHMLNDDSIGERTSVIRI